MQRALESSDRQGQHLDVGRPSPPRAPTAMRPLACSTSLEVRELRTRLKLLGLVRCWAPSLISSVLTLDATSSAVGCVSVFAQPQSMSLMNSRVGRRKIPPSPKRNLGFSFKLSTKHSYHPTSIGEGRETQTSPISRAGLRSREIPFGRVHELVPNRRLYLSQSNEREPARNRASAYVQRAVCVF